MIFLYGSGDAVAKPENVTCTRSIQNPRRWAFCLFHGIANKDEFSHEFRSPSRLFEPNANATASLADNEVVGVRHLIRFHAWWWEKWTESLLPNSGRFPLNVLRHDDTTEQSRQRDEQFKKSFPLVRFNSSGRILQFSVRHDIRSVAQNATTLRAPERYNTQSIRLMIDLTCFGHSK